MNLIQLVTLGAMFFSGIISVAGQCHADISVLHAIELGGRSSGELEIDARCYQAKEDLESFFGVKADLFFYEEKDAPRAVTLCSSNHPDIYDGTIRMGLALLKNELVLKPNGKHALTAVLAHEFAHIFQCRVGSSLRHFKRELQADFLAGYFLGRKNYDERYRLDIIPFTSELFENENWYEPFHHGTARERSQAMNEGFHHAHLSIEKAYLKSLYYYNNYRREMHESRPLQTCDLCLGKGTTQAHTDCRLCRGEGKFECSTCQGKGTFSAFGKQHECDSCAKTGLQTCKRCTGSGESGGSKICPKCNGKKRLPEKH